MKLLRTIAHKIPHWVIVSSGALIGISILSFLLRRALITGEDTTIGMFTLVHFAGYLFFIISPVEILYVHMLQAGHPASQLFVLAVGSAFVAQSIDYAIGYAFSETVLHNVIGEKKYRRHLRRIERWGGGVIFFFCLFPLSSPVVLLVAGMIRYRFLSTVVFSLAGLALKYLAFIFLFA